MNAREYFLFEYFVWIFRIVVQKGGEKLFSLEYAKAEYLFICLFIYLYSTLYVFC